MRRGFFVFALIAALSLLALACGSSEESEPGAAAVPTTAPTTAPTAMPEPTPEPTPAPEAHRDGGAYPAGREPSAQRAERPEHGA